MNPVPSDPPAGPPGPVAPAAVLAADFASPTGPVLHGATGSLYGVAEDGVPGDELLDALDLTTLAAGPDGGARHPGGDASGAVAVLRRNGRPRGTAGVAFVYLQDLFASWPYEDVG
ncbi:MAG: hypothetical protein HOQ43_18725, partial [Glycomyces artemisiae]|nr:hypothetical protein [Glycomyces artemisiae]